MTFPAALRHAIHAVLDVADDLTAEEIRSTVMSLIPKEYHAHAHH